MLIAILVIIGLAVLILGHEAGHFLVAKAFGMKVDEFGFGFPPRIFAKRKGETEYSVNWLPFGGFVRIAGENDSPEEDGVAQDSSRLFYAQKAWKRVAVTAAGVAVNFLIGWILLSIIFSIGTPSAVVVVGVDKNSPAQVAGLQTGDIITKYSSAGNDIKASTVQDFISFVNAHRGNEISVSVRGQSGEKNISVKPRTDASEPGLGISLNEAGAESMPVGKAIVYGLKQTGIFAWLTLKSFYQLIANLFVHASLLEGVVGPVGIFGVAQETGHISLIYLVQLMALISINLAVINLVPFPALDGGRIFLILVEKLKGSPVPRKVEGWINSIGFIFLIALILLITIRDISHLF